MENVVTQLTTSLGAAQLWETFGSVIPFLAVAVLFALGFNLVKSIIGGIRKKKMNTK